MMTVQPSSGCACPSIELSIVIVNWNTGDLLCRCVHSILDRATALQKTRGVWRLPSTGYCLEVLVVDSASLDGSAEMVRNAFPEVRLYASEINLGYTGGNNLGIRESRGRFVLLLNADTEVQDDALSTMVSYLEAHDRVGVLGPRLRYADGRVQSSRRRFPSLYTALIDSTFLEKWFPNHRELARYRMSDRSPDVVSDVDWLVGACLLVRREVIDQVGLLDDGYFMYSEELDWQKRIRDAGWKIVYLPSAKVMHYEGKSSEQVGALTHIRFGRSKVRYFGKHHSVSAGELVRVWLLINYAVEWMTEAIKWCLGHKRALRRARLQVYGRVLRSGLRARQVPS